MAEVVVQQGGQAAQSSQSHGAVGDIQGVFAWIGHYWWAILLVVLLLIAVAVIIYWIYLRNKEELRKDPMYVYWENTLEACELNTKKAWVKKKRRWWMIILGLPTCAIFGLSYLYLFLGEHWLYFFAWVIFGWLLWIPIAYFSYKDISMRVINVDMTTVGHYRGHAKRQDGYIYLLLCVGRKWVIMDDILVMRIPENVLTIRTIERKDKAGNIEKKLAWDKIEITSYTWNERDNFIFIPMTTLVKEATYFYEPTLVEGTKIVDLRQKIASSYHLMTQVQMAEQTYSQLGKVTNNAVDTNVSVVARKKEPEKQRDVQSGEGQQE